MFVFVEFTGGSAQASVMWHLLALFLVFLFFLSCFSVFVLPRFPSAPAFNAAGGEVYGFSVFRVVSSYLFPFSTLSVSFFLQPFWLFLATHSSEPQ